MATKHQPRSFSYRLPWPPSVNSYWRRGGNATYLTKAARDFRREVVRAIHEVDWHEAFSDAARLAVCLELTMPDRRRRDIDNHAKGVLDALQHAGVFRDDEQIDELRVKRLHVEPPGCCDVTICEMQGVG